MPSGFSIHSPIVNSWVISRAKLRSGTRPVAASSFWFAEPGQVDAHHRMQRHVLDELPEVAERVLGQHVVVRRDAARLVRQGRVGERDHHDLATARTPRAGAAGPRRRSPGSSTNRRSSCGSAAGRPTRDRPRPGSCRAGAASAASRTAPRSTARRSCRTGAAISALVGPNVAWVRKRAASVCVGTTTRERRGLRTGAAEVAGRRSLPPPPPPHAPIASSTAAAIARRSVRARWGLFKSEKFLTFSKGAPNDQCLFTGRRNAGRMPRPERHRSAEEGAKPGVKKRQTRRRLQAVSGPTDALAQS